MCGDLYLRGSESGSLRGSGEQAPYPCKGEGREVGEEAGNSSGSPSNRMKKVKELGAVKSREECEMAE